VKKCCIDHDFAFTFLGKFILRKFAWKHRLHIVNLKITKSLSSWAYVRPPQL
jgi:hypothetical protein